MRNAKVFVFGGYLPNGGAYMAFEVGQVLSELSKSDLVVVRPDDAQSGPCEWFEYATAAPEISVKELRSSGTTDDVLVINPSFHRFLPGLWFPGRLITYIQHFTTFEFLDPKCEHFVSGSRHIQSYVERLHGIHSDIINPFLVTEGLPDPIPWDQKEDRFLISMKGNPQANIALLDHVYAKGVSPDMMRSLHPAPRHETLDQINKHKFFLTFALTEGFGLLPLEAMALGSVVVGFDGFGGADYLQHSKNGFVLPFSEMERLPQFLSQVMARRDELEPIRDRAEMTTQRFRRWIFRQHWSDWLKVHFL